MEITTDNGQFLEKIDKKIDSLQKDLNDLRVEQAEIKGDIKALDAKVDGIAKRLDTQEFINRSVVVGFLLAIIAGITKLFFPSFG